MFTRIQGILNMFQVNPANAALYLIIYTVAILLSLMLHECGHGIVAYWCGDPTAKMMGRLTLNPAKHLDPLGTFSMLIVGFGWAKPVPVNTRHFKHFRRDYVLVSFAGIAVNLILFLFSMLFAVLLNQVIWIDEVPQYMKNNLFWLTDVLVSTGNVTEYIEFYKIPALMYLQFFFQIMAMMNISLAVFNLLPIPPMVDGWRILDGLVLKGRLQIKPSYFPYIQMVVILLLITGYLGKGLSYVTGAAMDGMLSFYQMIFGLT